MCVCVCVCVCCWHLFSFVSSNCSSHRKSPSILGSNRSKKTPYVSQTQSVLSGTIIMGANNPMMCTMTYNISIYKSQRLNCWKFTEY